MGPSEVEIIVVTMEFRPTDPGGVAAALARYVVLARGHQGCRNIDLLVSAGDDAHLLVVSKWSSAEAQRAHFDSPDMVAMAQAVTPLLAQPPTVHLYDAISAHDLT